jgi:hypothetical protein
MPTILNKNSVFEIKRRIWEGEPQHYVAADLGVTQPTISRIVNGDQWFHIPWPDGSLGALSTQRRLTLQAQKLDKYKRKTTPPPEEERASLEDLGDNVIDLAKRRVTKVAEEEEDQKLQDALRDFGKTGEEFQAAAVNIQDYDPLWKLFYEQARNLPLVEAAQKSPDPRSRSIVMYVLNGLQRDMWDSETAWRLVREAMELIKKG